MEYQILALDLDGTLTNSKKEISRPTLEALIDIQEQGKKVVLASGRPTKGVLPLAKQLHLEDYGSYILSFNGARITDCRSMQAIYNKTLPGDIVEPLLQILRKYDGLDILSYTADNILSGIKPNKYTELESRINHMPIIGLTSDQMICCGDGYNDITMIETAGLGVAMANAQPLVRERADYITKSNAEDGVLHVINEFLR